MSDSEKKRCHFFSVYKCFVLTAPFISDGVKTKEHKNFPGWSWTLIFGFSISLKRTTDIMFGGKQVVVCGYGEVSHS